MDMYESIGTHWIALHVNGNTIIAYTNLFSPNEYEKNDKIILKYFHELKGQNEKHYVVLFVVSIENLKILKYHTFPLKH